MAPSASGKKKQMRSWRSWWFCSFQCLVVVGFLAMLAAALFHYYTYMPVSHNPRCLGKSGKIEISKGLKLRAVVTGATGATGLPLVGELLRSEVFEKVTVLTRRRVVLPDEFGVDQAMEEEKGRLVQVIVDFDQLDHESGVSHFDKSDIHFCCLGSTFARASQLPGDAAENFFKIDHDLVVRLAKMAHDANVGHMSLVSSVGAHPDSRFLYMRTKGKSDESVAALGFQRTTIWRPGLLSRYTASPYVRQITRLLQGLPTEDLARALRLEAECEASAKSTTQKPLEFLHDSDTYMLLSLQG